MLRCRAISTPHRTPSTPSAQAKVADPAAAVVLAPQAVLLVAGLAATAATVVVPGDTHRLAITMRTVPERSSVCRLGPEIRFSTLRERFWQRQHLVRLEVKPPAVLV